MYFLDVNLFQQKAAKVGRQTLLKLQIYIFL